MQWGRSRYISTFPCSHGKIFFDDMDQETFKTQEKGHIRKIQKNKKERMEERKRRDF